MSAMGFCAAFARSPVLAPCSSCANARELPMPAEMASASQRGDRLREVRCGLMVLSPASVAAGGVPPDPPAATFQPALLTLPRDRGSGGLDLRLHGVEVEARALLHRRKLDRRHGELLHLLLHEDEAPELVLEPLEILLRAGLGAVLRPARALEGIEAKVGQIGDVDLGLVAEPATGLVDEAVLVVADAHGAELAFAEVPDLVTLRRALAGGLVR